MSADGSAVYAAGSDGHLYALAAGTGKILWEYPPKNQPGMGAVDAPPAVASDGSAVYVAGGQDVYALDASSGAPLNTWTTDPVELPSTIGTAGPALGTDAIYVGGGKHVNCLNRTNGALCWSPPFTADSRVVSAAVVNSNNGHIYFGTLDGKVYAALPSGR
jgi:outer membrane protein assembly factor BamB